MVMLAEHYEFVIGGDPDATPSMLLCSSRSNALLIDCGLELRLRCSMSCPLVRQDGTVLAGVKAEALRVACGQP